MGGDLPAWRLLPLGETGTLVGRAAPGGARYGAAEALRWTAVGYRALVAAERPAVVLDLVPAAETVLVHHEPGTAAAVRAWLDAVLPTAAAAPDQPWPDPGAAGPLPVPVSYDGEDLDGVARACGLPVSRVVAVHAGTLWRVAFVGFAPGFGYLTPAAGVRRADLAALLTVTRRSEPRHRVPAGSIALAGGYTGVYPRSGPGGWQLLGHTELPLWDLDADPPAQLWPGRLVRFEATR